MSSKGSYTLSLSGNKITIKNQEVTEEVALKIVTLLMGGSVATHPPLGTHHGEQQVNNGVNSSGANGGTPTPKVFMAHKKPLSAVERITCLAYYLSTYRDTPAFKTRDLTKLNTEAAQSGFSNATAFARDADVAGYLTKAGGGSKQITTLGEAIVNALPDREKVKTAIEEHASGRKRHTKKKGNGKKK